MTELTPLEWLWHVLEQRLGPEVVSELRLAYNRQLQAYQKTQREKVLQRRKDMHKS